MDDNYSLVSAIPARNTQSNRHNIGFMAVDEIARRHGFAPWRRALSERRSPKARSTAKCVVLLKPQTYMNESGRAVQEAIEFLQTGPVQT